MMLDFMGVEEDPGKHLDGPDPDPVTAPTPWLLSSPNSKPCDKPFEHLTDEDVMQLTREDCRRYLKDKGMRRPSWNKAQAVQQVMSLRGLCNPSQKKRAFTLDIDPVTAGANKAQKLNQSASSHLTMFYAGTVSIFNDVPVDKAYAIMLLASNIKSWASTGKVSATGVRELPQARKASLQRFLQKRRERFVKEDSLTEQSPPSESSKPAPGEGQRVESSSD